MSIALLDINDSNLQLWHEDVHLQSPGYALLENGQYRFGQVARLAARLRPRDINTRYWWQLNTEPLQPALGPARHTADLVHAHLQAMHAQGGQPGELIMAVPGSMHRDQLSLLLGIAQQCPFRAVGLVNRSAALGSLYGDAGRLHHLEFQLHQAVVTEVTIGAGQAAAGDSTALPGCGVLAIQERLVEIIAAAFIGQTRFDPRRKATTEQALYDALPAALADLAVAGETLLEVNGYRARVDFEALCAAGQNLFNSLPGALGAGSQDSPVIADPIAGLLPGLARYVPGLQVVPGDALARALRLHGDSLVQREESLRFVTELPCLEVDGKRGEGTPRPPAAAARQPTHLLREGTATPLGVTGTAIGEGWRILPGEAGGWQLDGTGAPPRINGRAFHPAQELRPGDRIRLASGEEVQLIEVASPA